MRAHAHTRTKAFALAFAWDNVHARLVNETAPVWGLIVSETRRRRRSTAHSHLPAVSGDGDGIDERWRSGSGECIECGLRTRVPRALGAPVKLKTKRLTKLMVCRCAVAAHSAPAANIHMLVPAPAHTHTFR